MTVIALWFRAEWRNRWRALIGLLLLIAFATAGVTSAFAGARRGATSGDRLLERTLPATVAVLPNQGEFDWDAVREMPEVEAVAPFVVAGFELVGLGEDANEVGGFPFVGDDVWRTIERPVVLDGRLPEPTRADEVAMTTNFASHFDKQVGDHLTIRLYTPEQVDAFDEGPAQGPTLDVVITGVIRSAWFSDQVGASFGGVAPSPGLYDQYAPNFMGHHGTGNINALVRLRDRGGLEAFEASFAEVTGQQNVEMMDLVGAADHLRNVVGFEARALSLLALAAAGASVLLIGLALSRFCAVSFRNLEVMRAFGLTPGQTRLAVSAAPASAAVGAVVLGGAVAVWASRWFPIGSAQLVEPDPGTGVDLLVLASVGVVVLLIVVGLCMWSVRAGRRADVDAPAAAGWIGIVTSSWPLRTGMGTRLALEGGSARTSTSGRSALVAAVLGVAGVVAALTFSAGIADATDGYERFGQTAELGAFFGAGNEDFVDSASALQAIATDADVDGVNDAYNSVASTGRGLVSLYTYAPVGDPIDVVMLEGRLPSTASEVALAPGTAEAEDVAVGDTITLTGTGAESELTVTGLAFIPTGPHNSYADGGWVLPAAYETLFDDFRFHFALVSTVPGADVDAVAARIGASTGIELFPGPIIPPIERAELGQLRTVPLLLAGVPRRARDRGDRAHADLDGPAAAARLRDAPSARNAAT